MRSQAASARTKRGAKTIPPETLVACSISLANKTRLSGGQISTDKPSCQGTSCTSAALRVVRHAYCAGDT